MAFMSITSTNPDLSYLLVKNPASRMQAKEIRKGTMFGYYSKQIYSFDFGDQKDVPGIEYCIYFRDAENDVSYKESEDQEFEYMNVTRYNSPLFVLDGIFNFLASLTKDEPHEKDTVGHLHQAKIAMLECHPKYLDIFKRTFKDIKMEFTPFPVVGNRAFNYKVTMTTTAYNLKEFINIVALFAMFHAIKCNHLSMVGAAEDQINKYMKILTATDTPYLIRYVTKIHLLRAPNKFKMFKEQLEKSDKCNIQMTFGNAYMQRQETIYAALKDRPNSIMDLGCGEGRYIPYLAKRLNEERFYYAIDTDPAVLEEATHLVRKKELENTLVLPSLEAYIESEATEPVDVVCTEVIEHMEIEEAEKLLKKLITLPQVKSLIITTPNSSFSKFYDDDAEEGEVNRHDDHKWEYTNDEFQLWVSQKITPLLQKHWGVYDLQYIHIGDNVDGECPTQGFIVRK